MYIFKDNDFLKGNNWYDIKFLLKNNYMSWEILEIIICYLNK